jgi:hypothetical protein
VLAKRAGLRDIETEIFSVTFSCWLLLLVSGTM